MEVEGGLGSAPSLPSLGWSEAGLPFCPARARARARAGAGPRGPALRCSSNTNWAAAADKASSSSAALPAMGASGRSSASEADKERDEEEEEEEEEGEVQVCLGSRRVRANECERVRGTKVPPHAEIEAPGDTQHQQQNKKRM